MTKNDFIKQYCVKSDITENELLESSVILPCKCGANDCIGWAVVSNNKISIKAHKDLYS